MQIATVEEILENYDMEIYPVTVVKFLLNRRKILSFFKKASEDGFELKNNIKIDNSDCLDCKGKDFKCRQHTSIERILTAKSVLIDYDTQTLLCKNEIFKMVGNRLVIIYCPHFRLITGEITDVKCKKITPITIEDPTLTTLPNYKFNHFSSKNLMNRNLKCWFNDQFSILTQPFGSNRVFWSLLTNKR